MSLYNRFFEGFDNDVNGGKEDYYHGEYDDNAYGKLYIPRIEEEEANFETVKKVFLANKIGLITSAVFTWLPTPASYKGRKEKYLFSANVYIKWDEASHEFQNHVLDGNKMKARVQVDERMGTYWIVRENTAFPSEELLEERYVNAELFETAFDVAMSALVEDEYDDEICYELGQIASEVALSAIN